jgi:hypothetical protein
MMHRGYFRFIILLLLHVKNLVQHAKDDKPGMLHHEIHPTHC